MKLPSGAILTLVRGDITRQDVDAIVNAANETLLGGGGVDGAIHRAAGPGLLGACKEIREVRPDVRCPTGEARVTTGFALPARFVIHTVGPIYRSHPQPAVALRNAYLSSLQAARQVGASTIAFPAISCGVYGYPLDEAARIAVQAAWDDSDELEEVRFVLFGEATFQAWSAAVEQLGA